MDTQETVLVSKVPMLKPNEFDMWKIRIRQYMLLTDYGMWEVVENGPGVDEAVAEGGARPPPRSDADRKRRQTEMKALSTLLLAIPNEYQHQFSTYTDAKSLWTALEKRFSGTKSTKRNQKAILKQQYENFTSLKNESMTQTFDRFNKLIGELATVDVKMDKDDVNRKFLRSLGEEWTIYTVSFRQGDDLEDKELEDLYNDLRIFKAEVEKKKRPIGYTHNTALLSFENPSSFNTTATYNTTANETVSNVNSCSSQEINEDTVLEALLASHVKSSLINDDLDQINADDLEEMDIKWQMAMLTLRMKRFIRRTGRNNFDLKRGDKAGFDKSKNNGSGSAQAPRFNNRGSNSNSSSSQALVCQEGQGFDWSDHAEEAVQNQALMAEIKETDIPTEVSSKLCSDSCLETVKKYRDHNQTMSDSIKKMERERREYVKIIDNLEDQIKAYKANELQFEYDHNYWKWEKKELERKLSKEKEEVESARKELSKAKEDLDKFSKSSKALESIIRAQVTDDLKRGIGYKSTTPPYNQNYIPPTTDLLHSIDRGELKEGLDRIDPVDSEEEFDKKSTSETIPDEHQILTNEKGGMPFVPSKKIETTRKDKGKSVMLSENKGKKTETTRKESRKDHYTQRTVVEPSTSSQSQNKNHPRGNKRNWNNHWAQCHGVDLTSLSNTTTSTSSGNNSVASDSSGNNFNSVEVNTAASNISSNNSNTATSQVNTAVSNNSSVNSNNVTTDKSSLRKPIITKYSSHEIPNKDYLLKLNRLTESNQGRRSSLWHVDSGCSRHMTGIMSLLEDFKKFEGGHVAFGDNPNGGKISGKGKVSKGKMTFDDVYFVEQLNPRKKEAKKPMCVAHVKKKTSERDQPKACSPLVFDLEIEKTAKKLRKQAKLRKKQGESTSSPVINIWKDIELSSDSESNTEERHLEEEEKPLTEEEPVTEAEEEEEMAAPPPERTLRQWAAPNVDDTPLCITYPAEEVGTELKTGLIHLLPRFHGLASEDPYKHMTEFHMVCLGMKPQGTNIENLKLKAFPFSLVDEARSWLFYLPPGSITTWAQMARAFLDKFFPASKAAGLRREICGIKQTNLESLYEYWERFCSRFF
ncbi:hypothetical protein OSB04_030800 [Centaurea solstitialis]|uniref:Retrotransposon gag domain-containing protein n=1 Tax=Centaurea solstitialis TaxID=347529 RepID=A0AA38VX15_9ASTR|nr:hypothetical protein OSB04_030800 [Centaurea solstitialis]